jgi:hypothetical protein
MRSRGVFPREQENGQVAQVVERSPEKAGVGGSTPSLATIFNNLQIITFAWVHYGSKTQSDPTSY